METNTKNKPIVQEVPANNQRLCKQIANSKLKKNTDSVTVAIGSPKQSSEGENIKIQLEKRVAFLEHELKVEIRELEAKYQSIKKNYETQVRNLEMRIDVLQRCNDELKYRNLNRNPKDRCLQTEVQTTSVSIQTPLSVMVKTNSSSGAKEDTYLLAMVRGLNNEVHLLKRELKKYKKLWENTKRTTAIKENDSKVNNDKQRSKTSSKSKRRL